jgi:hypothetical protein
LFAFGQCRLEMFFGAMIFKPVRTQRQPPVTDQVLNWAAYGLWEAPEAQLSHVLSDKEVADKKQLEVAADKKHNASANGKERRRRYATSTNGKAVLRRYATSTNGKAVRKRYASSQLKQHKAQTAGPPRSDTINGHGGQQRARTRPGTRERGCFTGHERAAADLPCSRRPTSRTWAALGPCWLGGSQVA